jgi:hypothetical protein
VLGTPPALILSQDQTLMFKRLGRLEGLRYFQTQGRLALALFCQVFVRLRACRRFGETLITRRSCCTARSI